MEPLAILCLGKQNSSPLSEFTMKLVPSKVQFRGRGKDKGTAGQKKRLHEGYL